MSFIPSLFPFLVTWLAIVFAGLTGRIAIGHSPVSASEYVVWFFLAAAPVAAYLVLLRNRESGSIAQVLYDAERAKD